MTYTQVILLALAIGATNIICLHLSYLLSRQRAELARQQEQLSHWIASMDQRLDRLEKGQRRAKAHEATDDEMNLHLHLRLAKLERQMLGEQALAD